MEKLNNGLKIMHCILPSYKKVNFLQLTKVNICGLAHSDSQPFVYDTYILFCLHHARRCDSMEKLKKRCDTLEKEIKDQWKFKEFYQFTFTFAKNPGQKGLGKMNV